MPGSQRECRENTSPMQGCKTGEVPYLGIASDGSVKYNKNGAEPARWRAYEGQSCFPLVLCN